MQHVSYEFRLYTVIGTQMLKDYIVGTVPFIWLFITYNKVRIQIKISYDLK